MTAEANPTLPRPDAAPRGSSQTEERSASEPFVDTSVGDRNRQIGWICAVLGALTGLVMGLWSFDGPVPTPGWLGEYGTTARRLARLGHIAFFGLGILNLLLARELSLSALGLQTKRVASRAMNFGNVFLPLTLFSAAAYPPLKYLLPLPASAVFLALILAAYGACPGTGRTRRQAARTSTAPEDPEA